MQDVCEAEVQPLNALEAIEAFFCELDPTVGDGPPNRAEMLIGSVAGWLIERFPFAGAAIFEDGRTAAHSASLGEPKVIQTVIH
jgi:hypothetical protein